MKSFITLAASTPFLLLAGVGHAGTFQYNDPNCSSFTIDSNGVISCADSSGGGTPSNPPSCTVSAPASTTVGTTVTISASCSNTPIDSYSWTGSPAVSGASTQLSFSAAGDYTYTVKATNAAGTGQNSASKTINVTAASSGGGGGGSVGGACPSNYVMPSNTIIVRMGGKDNLSSNEFNQAFDAPGNRIDSRSDAGQIKAWEFDNNSFAAGKITGTSGNFGSGYKDWTISACPGDFSSTLPSDCVKMGRSSLTMYYTSSDPSKCVVPPNQTMYLNIRASDPSQAAGYVVSNVPSAELP